MQSLINWTYGYQPYNDGEYLVLLKTPSGGTRISMDCYINYNRPGDGWEKYTYDVIEAYCSLDDIKPMGSTYLFDENAHIVNNKTLRDFHLDITGSFCDDIRDGDNEPYKNKHFVFLNKLDDYLRDRYGVKFESNALQFVEKD
jgi:hypothetical protein